MRVLLSGSSGLVGTALARLLRERGHEVVPLVRPGAAARGGPDGGPQRGTAASWNPASGELSGEAEGADAVVHLAGAGIADARWTPARKRVLIDSRVSATRNLVAALGKLRRPPRIFIGASASGYYGDRGDEVLTEASGPGRNFLAGLCVEWEAESARAAEFGARVVTPRIGVVLAPHGGALGKMLLPFRLGLGGPLGTGQQWMPWIALDDMAAILAFALATGTLNGPVNAVAPNPVRNAQFTKELGRALHRPAVLPAPALALRLAFGELADDALLSSARMKPQKLEALRYSFLHPELGPALAAVLAKKR